MSNKCLNIYKVLTLTFAISVACVADTAKGYNIFELCMHMKRELGYNLAVCVDSSYLEWERYGASETYTLQDGGERIGVNLSEKISKPLLNILNENFLYERYDLENSENGCIVAGEFDISNALEKDVTFTNGFEGTTFELINSISCENLYFWGVSDDVRTILSESHIQISRQPIKLSELLLRALRSKDVFWYSVNNNVHIVSTKNKEIKIHNNNINPGAKTKSEILKLFNWAEGAARDL